MHYVGTIVGQLTATDNEQDELTFSITSATSFFSINSSTGVIYIATPIDLEVNTPCMHDNMIAWTVFVSPNSQGGLAFATLSIMVRVADAIGGSNVPVSITVVDINDNAPIFQNLPNSVNVNEVRMLAVTCRSYLEDMFFFCVCVCVLFRILLGVLSFFEFKPLTEMFSEMQIFSFPLWLVTPSNFGEGLV